MDKFSILDLQVKHIKKHPNIFEDQKSEKRRAAIMMELIYWRCIAREDIRDYIEISERLRQCRRDHVKLREQGVQLLPLELKIRELSSGKESALTLIKIDGTIITALLDLYQKAGATLKDLCNFCNCENMLRKLRVESRNPFSQIVSVYCIDYLHDFSRDGWMKWEVDAPFTHCVKESIGNEKLIDQDGVIIDLYKKFLQK